jgi:hypothetical protein
MASSKIRPTPRIRLATRDDKDSFINSLITGYEVDPQYQWRIPRRKEFPEVARYACGKFFESVISDAGKKTFVAELPKIREEDLGSGEDLENIEWGVVSVAIWEVVEWDDIEKDPGKV